MASVDILIKNGYIVTVDKERRVIEDGAVVVERDKIVEIGKTPDIIGKYSAEKVIDARGTMVLPGLVNTHDHLFQVLYRSLGDDMELFEWAKIIHSLSEHLEDEDLYYSALTGCLEMI